MKKHCYVIQMLLVDASIYIFVLDVSVNSVVQGSREHHPCQSFSFFGVMEKQSHEKHCSSASLGPNEGKNKTKRKFLIRAVLFRDFLDGDAYLVAQVPPRVHHAIRAFTQNHVVTLLISLINVLLETEEIKRNSVDPCTPLWSIPRLATLNIVEVQIYIHNTYKYICGEKLLLLLINILIS